MTYTIIRELLSVRGIEHPCAFFGVEVWNKMSQYLLYSRKTYVRCEIGSVRHFAKLLDVTPSFLVACIKYGEMEEGLWIWKNIKKKLKE